MMYCTKCKIETKATAKFCPRCGGQLSSQPDSVAQSMQCPQCGKIYGPDHQFCADDGSQLQSQRSSTNSSLKPSPTTAPAPVLKIILLVIAILFLAVLGTAGYLYFSDRWMDIPVLAKWFTPPLTQKSLEGELTISTLNNAEYYTVKWNTPDRLEKRIKLVKGIYEKQGPNGLTDVESVSVGKIALGDLNGDGKKDGAVILYHNTGGSGTVVQVAAMLCVNGQPKHVASRNFGDRTEIKELKIINGYITVGVDNPRFYPGQRKTVKYLLVGNKLIGPEPFR